MVAGKKIENWMKKINPKLNANIISPLIINERAIMQDELLDIVDQLDQVIDQKWRSEVQKNRDSFIIRAVWLFIVNKNGKLWIPRRTASKTSFPLSLDGSA